MAEQEKSEAASHLTSVNPDESPLNANGFVGVDPIYQNFASITDAPEPEAVEGKAKKKSTSKASDKKADAPKAPASPKK
jgi:hypothetical protein